MIVAAGRAIGCRAALLLLAAVSAAAPAGAQNSAETRLRKAEAEIRALQRKVFPDGANRYFEPEIRPNGTLPALPATTSAVTDLLARVDAIEAQLARLTAQIEQNGNLAARVAALESSAALPARPVGQPMVGPPIGPGSAGQPISRPLTPGANIVAPGAGADRQRLAAMATIPRPQTDDPGEDDYLYGYRLWEGRFYPEAVQQLQATIDKHPGHKRISYARNLLGRAYLEDGKPGTAAQVFLQNYQANRNGARAPDSLLYLAIAMTRLKEAARACIALQELSEGYPAEVAGRLNAEYTAARAAVQCN